MKSLPACPASFTRATLTTFINQKHLAAGADAYVAKPDIEGLIDNVRRLLSERACAAAVAAT